MTDTSEKIIHQPTQPTYSLWQIIGYMFKLGTIGFGGPIALIGYMHRDLVENRHWISEGEYTEGMVLAQVAPGPLAAQLSIYLGYIHYGLLGASLVGGAFVLPSFLMVVAMGWAYVHFGGLPWMQAAFYGIGACVIGIISLSAYKLTRKMVQGWLLWVIYLITLAITVIREVEEVWVFVLSGILVWLIESPPDWLRRPKSLGIITNPLLLVAQTGVSATHSANLWTIFAFFAKAGTFVFGSGLAILPFLYGGAVKEYHWITDRQFLDAVAVAMITPGPVVITVAFVGFLVAGLTGAIMAGIGVFIPCYLITVIAAPYFRKHGKKPEIAAFVRGVTAAATGAIAGAVIVIGRRSLVDIPTILIALIALGFLWKFKKISEPLLVLAAAIVGLVLYPLTHS